jgi:hypothetical protein
VRYDPPAAQIERARRRAARSPPTECAPCAISGPLPALARANAALNRASSSPGAAALAALAAVVASGELHRQIVSRIAAIVDASERTGASPKRTTIASAHDAQRDAREADADHHIAQPRRRRVDSRGGARTRAKRARGGRGARPLRGANSQRIPSRRSIARPCRIDAIAGTVLDPASREHAIAGPHC